MALAAVALWSTVATAFKLGLEQLSPLQLLAAGSSVSLLVFICAAFADRTITGLARLDLPTHLLCALLGLLNPFLYYMVLFEAYARLPAQVAQPLNYTWAVTLAILSVPILRQRLTRRDLAGIAISYLGVALLLGRGDTSLALDIDAAGVALALGSTLIWATYWLLNTRASLPPTLTMTLSFFWGTLAIVITCLVTHEFPPLDTRTLLFGGWVGLIEMGLTFLLWQGALRRTRHVGRLGQLIFLSPFVSFIFIASILGETIHASSLAALVLIATGLFVAQRA